MDQIAEWEIGSRWPELIKCVERGESVTITREGQPVAQLSPAVDEKQRRALAAVERIKALRKEFKSIPVDELIAMKHEGHRY